MKKTALVYIIVGCVLFFSNAFADSANSIPDEIDLTYINDPAYDLSKPLLQVKPTLGRGLRDMQNSSGGSACTSCAH